jgi:hypothetical protein
MVASRLVETKSGVCVRTVSIVCGCRNLPDSASADQVDRIDVVANLTSRSRWTLVADAADGADGTDGTDGTFLSCTYPNDPAAGSALAHPVSE